MLDSVFKRQIDESLSMNADIGTVIKRTQLAQELCKLAQKHKKDCEQLVSDQHMQHQGIFFYFLKPFRI